MSGQRGDKARGEAGSAGWWRRGVRRRGQAGWRSAICWLMTVETPSPRIVMP
jgi:hypothetical protein